MRTRLALAIVLVSSTFGRAQTPLQPNWTNVQEETLRHFQTLVVRLDTSNPPGNERSAVQGTQAGARPGRHRVTVFALDPGRSNLVARLKGNGRKRPLLLMGHTDVVTVDAAKWKYPPFSATRDGGYVYGRGTVDDKDNLTAALMTMLLLKRLNVSLDRRCDLPSRGGRRRYDEGWNSVHGESTFSRLDAEYCLAEGAGVTRIGGQVKYATVQTLEKVPRGIELVAHGISGHGSIPLKSNAVVHLSAALPGSARGDPNPTQRDDLHLLPTPG